MTADDDDHEDDKLRQLRSVWVSMRDEEPSDRGLAALMAAARDKASQLEVEAQPSWWHRALAALRRPPVLALATVTLLFGGAVYVTQHSAKMKAESTISSDREHAVAPAPSVQPESTQQRVGDPAWEGTAGSAAAAPMTPPADPQGAPGAIRNNIGEQAPRAKSKPKLATPPSHAADKPRGDEGAREAPHAPPKTAPTAPQAIATDDLSSADKGDEEKAATKSRGAGAATGSTPTVSRAPMPSIEGEDRTKAPPATPATPATIDQLVKQCESAAARGDCVAVRGLVRRIESASPSTYKKRLGTNPAVERCLAPSVGE